MALQFILALYTFGTFLIKNGYSTRTRGYKMLRA